MTTSGALLALAVTAKNPALALVGIGAVVVFAYIETTYIYIQDRVVGRCNLIERLLDETIRGHVAPGDGRHRFGISQAFEGRFTFRRLAAGLSGRPHIYVLHLGLIAALATAAIVVAISS